MQPEFQHTENVISVKDHAFESVEKVSSEDRYAHFKPQEIQSVPKFIQLEQGARNVPADYPIASNWVAQLKHKWW